LSGYAIDTIGSFHPIPNGGQPASGLVADSNGNLYGTTAAGGANGYGTVFEIPKGSNSIETLYSFNYWYEPNPAVPLVVDSAGDLFGVTAYTTYTYGTVFEIPQGSNTFTPLASFTNNALGTNPNALAIDASGNLFGTTSGGGSNNSGVVFELARGSTTIATLASLGPTNYGPGQYGAVVLDANDDVFGVTESGGTAYDGSIFELARGSAAITTLASFVSPDSANGGQLDLAMDAGGNLYGTTSGFGGYSGILYEFPAGANAITTIAVFNGANGTAPEGSLLLDPSGDLYGTTSSGGANGDGTIFEIAKGTTTLSTLFSFDSANGAQPEAQLVLDSAGNLFGTTAFGGANNQGTVFELPQGTTSVTSIASFINNDVGDEPAGSLVEDSAGNIYGTTTHGGTSNYGTFFEIPAGSTTVTTLTSFDGADGAHPGGLVEDASGNFYGSTADGGASNQGTLFEIAQGSTTITTLASFNYATTGESPDGNLLIDPAGNIFGSTTTTVFELSHGASQVTVLAQVWSTGHLVEDTAGNLYGTIRPGIYGMSLSGGVFMIASGSKTATLTTPNLICDSGLAIDAAGNIYGTTSYGGTSGEGVIFEIPAGQTAVTTLASFPYPASGNPYGGGGLAFDDSGSIYGTYSYHGESGVFELPNGATTISLLGSLTPAGETEPTGSLILDSSGNLYGTSLIGGVANAGVIFRVSPSSKLAFTVQPASTGPAGSTLGQWTAPDDAIEVRVSIEDAAGDVAASDNSNVTLTLNGGTFADGTTSRTVTAVNGAAAFANLVIDAAGTYTLVATGGSLASATSNTLTVTPAAPSKFVILQQPTAGIVGQPLSPAISLAVDDAFGNLVPSGSSAVLISGIGNAQWVATSGGIVTFNNLVPIGAGNVTWQAFDSMGFQSSQNVIPISPGPTTTTVANASGTYTGLISLKATVTAGSLPAYQGTVTFTVLQGSTIVITATSSGWATGGVATAQVFDWTHPAGTYTIQATYNGGSSFVASTAATPGTLTVAPYTPAINWPTPASITYGTPLSGTQLDASVYPATPGTFTYTPPAGAVLNAGYNQLLQVQFIPTDITDYAGSTETIRINVLKATPVISVSGTGPNPSTPDQPLSFTINASGGVPDGESVLLKDASNGNAVIGSGKLAGGVAALVVPAGTFSLGTHNLIAVYAGDANFASSQSVAYAQNVVLVPPPLLVGAPVINGDDPNGLFTAPGQPNPGVQRSMVEDIVYTFDEPVTIPDANAAFSVVGTGPHAGNVPATLIATAVPGTNNTQWAVSLTGNADGVLASIANGEYSITINPIAVFAATDGTTAMTSGRTDSFYRLFGDINGDRVVNVSDEFQFSKAMNAYTPIFDVNGDGTTNLADEFQASKSFSSGGFLGDGFVTTI
jgi:uncharacterized repeat protein (TIGR03803 family)